MSVTAAQALADLFRGVPPIGKLVKDFDFTRIDVKDSSREDYLTVKLAPAYGNLTSESIKTIDSRLKVMIAGAVKTIAQIPAADRTWDRIVAALMQCPLMEPDGDAVKRTDKLIKSGVNVFRFDGSPDTAIVKEVQSWFVNLINDTDVYKSTQIDITVLANIVAQTGATIDSLETVFYKKESHDKTLVDIGVLRFPDTKNPHFKVYRIQLTAWSQSSRILMVQDDQNGITGEFILRKFKPRDDVIRGMSSEAHGKAVDEANKLFG
ncbi:hypothetical protein MFIFM68171_02523 [Madurella fahalii]|uniref:Uncharacterized protein n=1 Tax=Madurella fahalii TaxID=1157608 RepID=A0ABQ0G3G7_9PEZI